jgi:adenylate cyclase
MDAETLIAEAELKAERITALARLCVPVVIAPVIYFGVGRSSLAQDPTFARAIDSAAVVLGAYVVLAVISYVFATPKLYRPWVPWALVSCDFVFLFGQLAFTADNFRLPPAYVAIYPAFWVSLPFLALAVLRYKPLIQLYVTALLGIGLAGFVVLDPWWTAPGEPPAELLHSLLAGPPTALRITILILTGVVLIIAAARARNLLHRAINETVRRANLVRYFPPQLAERLAESSMDAVRLGRQQNVAVLFADIRGFTERAETMEPAALSRFVAEFRSVATRAAHANGGVVDKFIGDNAMIVFGVPESSAADAANALACARAILADIARWNSVRQAAGEDLIRVGVGVHWGRVFSGAVGDDTRLEFTVLGDTVNVAARLEEETKRAALPLLASEDVLKAAAVDPAEAGWTLLPATPLRGRHGVVRVYGFTAGRPGQISA